MEALRDVYGGSQALLTDLYQLTMAQGYWQQQMDRHDAVFHLSFRRHPFGGRYAVACGIRRAVDLVCGLRFDDGDLQYLAGIRGRKQRPLFAEEFLRYLGEMQMRCDLHAVREGTVVFANTPLLRIRGPLLQAQLLETALLNVVNFETLIATKASRVVRAAGEGTVLEFGLRRAQGIDGGLSASRAAYVGGCHATSNVLAGKLYDIPVRGTHAHSWVMAFDTELEAFEAYAQAMPDNCVFLVDTYDTLEGVEHAIAVASRLRQQGHELIGIRLDSGDLVELSKQARKKLNAANLADAKIVASSDLDEHAITRIKQAGGRIDVWGVGTRLATAHDQPALGGVYKLAALRAHRNEPWQYRMKVSADGKTSDPGVLQVRRFTVDGRFWGDLLYNEPDGVTMPLAVIDGESGAVEQPPDGCSYGDLLEPLVVDGQPAGAMPSAGEARQYGEWQLGQLEECHRRLQNPTRYRVGDDRQLQQLRRRLFQASE